MIAPLREPGTAAPRRGRMCEVHEFVATNLMDDSREDHGPAVTPWQAWAIVVWMVFVVGMYGMAMLGWW